MLEIFRSPTLIFLRHKSVYDVLMMRAATAAFTGETGMKESKPHSVRCHREGAV
jgi:hypothetical protein